MDNQEILKIRIPEGLSAKIKNETSGPNPIFLNKGDFTRQAIRIQLMITDLERIAKALETLIKSLNIKESKDGEQPRLIETLLKRGMKL